jgi:hypothetical protein
MSAEDYVDAFEKLLRLGLSGKQAWVNAFEDQLFRMYITIFFSYALSVCWLICRIEKL